ncbi:hypothetical protein [Donghicola tyrosinivorans]|uniref:hypothetical protein n=1 Tax=Donghicola tyrosinivorans TaxID=1652492 RepID=UPI001474171B|nr:hypothetical protein [Donghicola tyrosinivorans]
MVESWESLRGLIERIVLIPHEQCDGYVIDLSGELGALLNLATGSTATALNRPESQVSDIFSELFLVAGVGFEPTTFRL